MLKIVRASALILVLACAASAGETPNNITEEPIWPPATLTQEPAAGAGARETPTTDSYRETLLNLLDSVLAFF